MIGRSLAAFFGLCWACIGLGFAQAPVPHVSSGRIVRIEALPSKYVVPRPIDVWLPDGYTAEKQYPVIYMQDGQMLFDSTTTWTKQEWRVDETLGDLIKAGTVQACIVVGVHNAGLKRFQEYWPQKPYEGMAEKDKEYLRAYRDRLLKTTGEPTSDKYLKYLVEEVKPYVDSAFSTLPDRPSTFIMGSSYGGLISWYAWCEYPKVFGGAACLSTHWTGVFERNDAVAESFYQYLKKKIPSPHVRGIYMDYGDQSLDTLYGRYQPRVTSLIKEKGYTKSNSLINFYPGANHSERAWAARLHTPLEFLLSYESVVEPPKWR